MASSSSPSPSSASCANADDAPAQSNSKPKAKAKAKAKAKNVLPTSAVQVPAHVLDHLLDLLIACGDLPSSFHASDSSLVTESYLVAKLKSMLDARGHLPFHQLVPLLQISQQTADHILDLVLADSCGSIFLADAFVVTGAGYTALERQLIELVRRRGVASADTLANSTGTSTGLVYLILDKPHISAEIGDDNPTIHRDSIDTSVYFSSAFGASLSTRLSAALLAATEPVDIKPILSSTSCPAGLWQSTLYTLSPTLDGRLTGSLYTPTSYLTVQLDQTRSLLATAGYVPLATTPPAVLSQLASDPQSPPPWQLASVLISAAHAKALLETVQALAEEATGAKDELLVDVTAQAPSVADPADAKAFVDRAFASPTWRSSPLLSLFLTAGSKIAYRPALFRECLRLALDPIVDAVLAAIPAGDAPTPGGGEVTRAMVAKPLAFLPSAMRDALLPELMVHVQAAVDAALVHRSDPRVALAYWTARLAVFSGGLAHLALPKPTAKVLDRGMVRRMGPPLRDALVAGMPFGADEGDQVAQVVTQAVNTKSSGVVLKVVETVCKAHGMRVPSGEEVEAERQAMREEITRVSEDKKAGVTVASGGGKPKRRGATDRQADQHRTVDDRKLEWWRVAERLVMEKDAVVWLDATVPDDVVQVLVDKVLERRDDGES